MNPRALLLTLLLAALPGLSSGAGMSMREEALRKANGANIADDFEREQMIPYSLGTIAPLMNEVRAIKAENEKRFKAYQNRAKTPSRCPIANFAAFRLPEEQELAIPLDQCLEAYTQGVALLVEGPVKKAGNKPRSFVELQQNLVTDEEKEVAQALKTHTQQTVELLKTTLQDKAVLGNIIPPARYRAAISHAKEFTKALAPLSNNSTFFKTLQKQAEETLTDTRNPLTDDLRTCQVAYQELFKLESPWMSALKTEIKARYTWSKKKVLLVPLLDRDVLNAKVDLTRCQLASFHEKVRTALKEADTCMQTYFGRLPFFTQQLATAYQTVIGSGLSVILARSIANEISAKSSVLAEACQDILKKAFKKKQPLLDLLEAFNAGTAGYGELLTAAGPVLTKKETEAAQSLEKDFCDDTDSLQASLVQCAGEVPEIMQTQEVINLKENLLTLYRLFALCRAQEFEEKSVLAARFPGANTTIAVPPRPPAATPTLILTNGEPETALGSTSDEVD